jgi:antitoxin MazE
MLRKILKTGNSLVVSLPKDALEFLQIDKGQDVSVELDREKRQIVITPADLPQTIAKVDPKFTSQVADFIEQYRPALEELAK